MNKANCQIVAIAELDVNAVEARYVADNEILPPVAGVQTWRTVMSEMDA